MTPTRTPADGLLARIRDALFAPECPVPEQRAADALHQTTRWAWLPALSGVAVAADEAVFAHDAAVPGGAD